MTRSAIMILYHDNGSFGADGGLNVDKQRIKEALGERAVKILPYSLENGEEVKMILGTMVKFASGRNNPNNGHSNGFENIGEMDFDSAEEMSLFRQFRVLFRQSMKEGGALREGAKRVWKGSERYEAEKKTG